MLQRFLEWAVMLITALLVTDVLAGIVVRYLSRLDAFVWLAGSRLQVGGVTLFAARGTDEMATALLIWLTLLGAALVFREKGHLGVDYFVRKLDPDARRIAGFAIYLTILIFNVVVLLYGGGTVVARTLDAGQTLPALGWPKGYIYLAIPAGGAFMTLAAVGELLGHIVRPREETVAMDA